MGEWSASMLESFGSRAVNAKAPPLNPAVRPQLLIVEDDELLAELLSYNLEAAGFDVRTTDDGNAALDLLARERFAALLIDWAMPKLSGIELCRRLRLLPDGRRVPVLMLSAKGGEDDRRCGLESGADLFLTKPCGMGELIRHLRRMIAAEG